MKTNLRVIGAVLAWSLLWCGCETANVSTKAWKEHIRQGESARDSGDWMGADLNFASALTEIQAVETNSQRVITTLDNLAETRSAMRRYADAERLLQQRLQIGQVLGWTNTIEYMVALENLADVKAYQKKYDEAEQTYLRAESLLEYKSSRMDPRFGVLQSSHAKLYMMQRRFDEADACYQKAKANIELLERSSSPTSYQRSFAVTELGAVLNDYGLLKLETKKYAEAEKLFRKAISELESQYGGTSLHLVTPLNNLAVTYAHLGNFEEGEKAANRSIKIMDKGGVTAQSAMPQTEKILSAIRERKIPE